MKLVRGSTTSTRHLGIQKHNIAMLCVVWRGIGWNWPWPGRLSSAITQKRLDISHSFDPESAGPKAEQHCVPYAKVSSERVYTQTNVVGSYTEGDQYLPKLQIGEGRTRDRKMRVPSVYHPAT